MPTWRIAAAPLAQHSGSAGLEDSPVDGDFVRIGNCGSTGDKIIGPVQQDVGLVEVAKQDVGIDRLAKDANSLITIHEGQNVIIDELTIVIQGGGIGRRVVVEITDFLQTHPFGPVPGTRPLATWTRHLGPIRIGSTLIFEKISHQPYPSARKWTGDS